MNRRVRCVIRSWSVGVSAFVSAALVVTKKVLDGKLMAEKNIEVRIKYDDVTIVQEKTTMKGLDETMRKFKKKLC